MSWLPRWVQVLTSVVPWPAAHASVRGCGWCWVGENDPMAAPAGFAHMSRAGGSVIILRRGRAVTSLRGDRAAKFPAEAGDGDPGEVMARWAGNYRRASERTARSHPRDTGR